MALIATEGGLVIHNGIFAPRPGPDRSRLAIEQATAALALGDPLDAERVLRSRLLEQPGDADALAKLAEIAIGQHRLEEAALLLRRAAEADPSLPLRMALVSHLLTLGGPAVALEEVEASPGPIRHAFDIRMFEAALLGMLGDHDRQVTLYEELATQHPRNAMLWIGLGNALKTVGRTDDAVAAVRRAIKVQPTFGEAYWTLANFKSFRFTSADVAAMRRALRRRIGDADRLHLEFALGKALEDRGDYAGSFRHYDAGNRTHSAALKAGDASVTQLVDLAIATFSRELLDRHSNAGCKSAAPIFIVGLHRSGSTLIEQILSCHPMIEGTSELPVMQQIWERIARNAETRGRSPFREIAEWEPSAFDAIGNEYLERARPFRRTDRPMFIDKLPANWLNLGLISLALPNARIIDARRHPMACGFSNFRQHYRTGVAFAYRLESIGRFYRDYLRFMDHMDRARRRPAHRLLNERLIEDPEREIRRLLDYLEVPFDPACLDFHRSDRAVRTPSAEQVRRPINRDGVDSWRRYQPWLEPLERALGPALAEWDNPFE